VSLIVLAFPLSCMTEGLAGVAAGEHVHGLDLGPVDGRDVAQIQDAGVVGGEHLAGRGLDVGDPRQLAAEDRLHGHV